MIDYYNLNGKQISRANRALSWRLIYSGSQLIALFESEGITQTPETLEEFPNRPSALARINALNLNTGSLEI